VSAPGPRRRGLLVDYGGVLTTDLFASFRSFCELEGLGPDALIRKLQDEPRARGLLVALEEGRLAEEAFEPELAAMLDVSPEKLIDRLFAHSGPDVAMVDAVRDARRAGIRTGLLSNSWGTRRYDKSRLVELFDAVVISGEEGMRKPAPEIYSLAAERLGLAPAEIVFVDDLPHNLSPAEKLGMAVVHHRESATTIPALERLLGVALDPAAE
jgi:putative hydrolase of the HAD superfamily